MAKRKPKNTADEWKGFVKYHIPVDIKKAAGQYRESWDILGNILPSMVGERYKVTLSYNDRDGTVIASATCRDPANENYQRTLSSFATDVHEALLRLCYIHFVVFEEQWPDDDQRSDEGW